MLKFNPWIKIWSKPRETLREIKAYHPNHRLVVLSMIYGFLFMLSMCQTLSAGHYYSTSGIVLFSVILAWPIGYIMISLSSVFFFFVSKMLKGVASYREVRAAVAWSNVPSIVVILTWIALIGAYGPYMFMFNHPVLQSGFCQLMQVIQWVMAIWSVVILIIGLSEVEGFSKARAFGATLIVIGIWFVVSMTVALLGAYFSETETIAMLQLI